MKVIIAGSRHLDPLKFFNAPRRDASTERLFRIISQHLCYLEGELNQETTEIVSGGARGIDTVGEAFANYPIPARMGPRQTRRVATQRGNGGLL